MQRSIGWRERGGLKEWDGLDAGPRAKLIRAALMLCATSLLLVPLAGRTTGEIAEERTAFVAHFAAPDLPLPSIQQEVSIRRDPFVADESAVAVPPAIAMAVPPVPDASFALPANRGAAGTPFPQLGLSTESAVVRAVVTGARSRALVDADGTTRVVSAGDTIDGLKVERIGSFGVEFSNGQFLPIESATP